MALTQSVSRHSATSWLRCRRRRRRRLIAHPPRPGPDPESRPHIPARRVDDDGGDSPSPRDPPTRYRYAFIPSLSAPPSHHHDRYQSVCQHLPCLPGHWSLERVSSLHDIEALPSPRLRSHSPSHSHHQTASSSASSRRTLTSQKMQLDHGDRRPSQRLPVNPRRHKVAPEQRKRVATA